MNFTEIYKLATMLQEADIPFTLRGLWDGYQICYPSERNKICDAILHGGSYGHEAGLLEIMGLLTDEESVYDDVVGWLTAEEVFERIKKDWKERR